MLEIPILRQGRPYASIDKVTLVHHATGEPIARVSQANSGLIVRDIHRLADDVLERFSVTELIAMGRKAADLFLTATLPLGDAQQTFDDYIAQLSATTGMPITYCRDNAKKIHRVLAELDTIISGLTRGFDLTILDRGHGAHLPEPQAAATRHGSARADAPQQQTLSFFREGRIFGAVLPSNSPGVHGLWIPAIALKTPIILKPGREEPWTPYRIIEALAAAGVPREAFGFYPTDHAGAGEILRNTNRSMLFGGGDTTKPWQGDPRVELHGPGYSKVLLGDDTADDWERYVDVMVSSILANGGRSCINASGIWTPRHADAIAEAVAARLADVKALPADDASAQIAGFANAAFAEQINAAIDHGLTGAGAEDVCDRLRGSPRLQHLGRVRYLLPSIIRCESADHALANREFLFPFASVIECPTDAMPHAIGPSLVVSAITADQSFAAALMASPHVDRLNLGAIPTCQLAWDQPHEGNLFEHLYRRRALQVDHAA